MTATKVDYLDLDVLIERSGKGYRARILSSPAGEVDAIPFHLPFNRDQLENFVLKMGRPVAMTRGFGRGETRVARDFGERLFGSLFHDQLATCLRSSLEVARDQSLGLRVRLRLSGSPELANVPWEYFYDPEEQRFLVLSDATPLVRYLELPRRVQLLSVEPPLRILVMISRPKGFQALDVDREWSLIQHALKPLTDAGRVYVERIEEASMAGLQRRLRRGQFHVFHFIGHGGFDQGEATGTLVLEGLDRQPSLVSSEHLSTVLCDHETLRLVLLNACEGARTDERSPFAGVAARLVQQGVPAVVAMQFAITDEAAIAFTETFYETVADSYPVDTAVTQGRKAILNVTSDAEWGTPVLYMRSRDGRLFEVAGSPALAAGGSKPEPTPPVEDTEIAKEPAASTRHVDAAATGARAPEVPVVVVEPTMETEPVAPNGAREPWEPLRSPPESTDVPAEDTEGVRRPRPWESIDNPLSAGLVGGLVAAAAVILLLAPLTVQSRSDFNPYAIVLLAAAAVALGGSVLMIRGMRSGRAIVLGCLAVILIVTVGVVALGSPAAPAASPSLAAAGRLAVGLGSLILVLLVAFSRFPGFASGGPGAPTRSLALALAFAVIAPAPSVYSFVAHPPPPVVGPRPSPHPTPTPAPPRPVVAGTWSRVGDMTSPRFAHSATLLGDGTVLVAGGKTLQNQERGLSSAEIYDPASKQWHAVSNMTVGRQGHVAVALPNGRVLVAGGTDSNGKPTNSAEIYDVSKGSWSAAQPMLGTDTGFHAFPLAQGKQVLFISESGGSAEIYDSGSGRWKQAASFERREHNERAQLSDGKVMIMGGFLTGADNSPTAKAEIYDPASDAWRSAAGPNLPRAFAPAIALKDGRVVLMGGYTGKKNSFDSVTGAVEIYSPSNNTWSNAASAPGPVLTCYCRMILDGNAILAPRATERALSNDDSAQSTKTYLYDVRADRWIVDNPLTVSLASGGNAVVLADGHVLVTGGAVDLHRASPVAELYTPG